MLLLLIVVQLGFLCFAECVNPLIGLNSFVFSVMCLLHVFDGYAHYVISVHGHCCKFIYFVECMFIFWFISLWCVIYDWHCCVNLHVQAYYGFARCLYMRALHHYFILIAPP